MYQDAQGNVIPDASVIGYRSIATPGSVAGLVYAERKYGKLGLRRVMAPAIQLAFQGFELTAEEAAEWPTKIRPASPTRSASFSATANSTKQARSSGSRGGGAQSRPIPTTFIMAGWRASGPRMKGGALLMLQDLAQYKVVERKPVTGIFHTYNSSSAAPPPSSGGVVLVSALNILESYSPGETNSRTVVRVDAHDRRGH